MSELDIVDFVLPKARTERADFSDSDEEILNEIGEDDQQLYPDSDWKGGGRHFYLKRSLIN